MAKILVIGASKGIGLEFTRQAASAGHRVRAMARGADRISLNSDNLEKFSGDALNALDVQSALKNIDIVVQTLGIPVGIDMITKPVTLFSEATRVLLPEMQKAAVRRLISVTGYGAGDSRASIGCLQRIPFNLLLANAYDDKSIQEDLISASDLDWTICRPGVLTNQGKSGNYKVLVKEAEWRNGVISRGDVADFILCQIDREPLIGKKPVLIKQTFSRLLA
jgi:putative NADH-flavin reductase